MSRTRRTTPPAHRQRPKGPTAAEWNAQHPVGTRVLYRSHPKAEPVDTVTRSVAWTLDGGQAVVQVEGRAGGVALWSLEVVPPDPAWVFVAKIAEMYAEAPGSCEQGRLATEARALLEGRARG